MRFDHTSRETMNMKHLSVTMPDGVELTDLAGGADDVPVVSVHSVQIVEEEEVEAEVEVEGEQEAEPETEED